MILPNILVECMFLFLMLTSIGESLLYCLFPLSYCQQSEITVEDASPQTTGSGRGTPSRHDQQKNGAAYTFKNPNFEVRFLDI